MSRETTIIAEAGINHNGHLDMALRLIEEAAKAGADYIKFQTFDTNASESQYSLKPSYFEGRDGNQSKTDLLRSLELDASQFRELYDYCKEVGIKFLSTACDIPSAKILVELGCDIVKIGSSDSLNYPLFKFIGQHKLKVIYSTGVCTLNEVRAAVKYLEDSGVESMDILQCTSQYPSPYEDLALPVLTTYMNEFKYSVGLSDHSEGCHIPCAAVAMGSSIIEKHFTLSRDLPGVDHPASLNPEEFTQMVKAIRDIEAALSKSEKSVQPSEIINRDAMRKSLFTIKNIRKGDLFTMDNIGAKRPGTGISPTKIDDFLEKYASCDILEDNFIETSMVKVDT